MYKRTLNSYNQRDLGRVFTELDRVIENVVKGKLYPMLERSLERANRAINRRLTARMSKLHPWVICFEVAMPKEVFNLLYKTILGESSYGLKIEECPRTVTLRFTKLERLVALFNRFIECKRFKKQLPGGKGHVQVIVDEENKSVFKYVIKEDILKTELWVLEPIWHKPTLTQTKVYIYIYIYRASRPPPRLPP